VNSSPFTQAVELVPMVKDGGKSIGELSRDLGVADSGIRALGRASEG